MKKDYEQFKKEAIKLRKRGLSYNEIRKKIPVAKSTLSLWLKSVPLKEEHRKRLYTKQIEILARGPQSQKERRKREVDAIIEGAKKEISFPLSKEAYQLFGVAIYWSEGSKTKHFEVTNSDPRLIAFMVEWFRTIFNISSKQMKAHLNIYKQQDEKKLKRFWSELTGIPVGNFGKSFIKPPNKGYKKNTLYYGTIKVRIACGTDMRHKVFGWAEAVLQNIEPKVQLTQKRWSVLREKERPLANL